MYAKERDDGPGFVWGLEPESYEKVRLGYACGNCLEEFMAGGSPIALAECSLCKQPTAIAGIDRVITDTPEEWVEYLKKREKALAERKGRRRR